MKIVVTGHKGKVGSVIYGSLKKSYTVTGLDLPEFDLSNFEEALESTKGADVLFHLAYKGEKDNWRTNYIEPENIVLVMNVLNAAVENQIKLVVLASSVHADDFLTYEGDQLLTPDSKPRPTSPYGARNLLNESLGNLYSHNNDIKIIAIRFGGVSVDGRPKDFGKEPSVWLSHDDLGSLVNCIVQKPLEELDKFTLLYAVSDNEGRIHSIDNPFGWQPRHNSKDLLKTDESS